ncbi:MAG: hypothetical protein ACM3NH_02425 [Candidatus Saccharibacteria bacterium]
MDETNVPQTEPEKQEPILPGPIPKKSRGGLAVAIAVIVVLAGGVSGYYWNSSRPKTEKPAEQQQQNNQDQPQQPTGATTEEPLVSGIIAWHFPSETAGSLLKKIEAAPGDISYFDPIANAKYFELGAFQGGLYKGATVVMLQTPCEGPCSDLIYYFAKKDAQYVLLQKYSDSYTDYPYLNQAKFTVDKTYDIKDLDFPETIQGNLPRQKLTLADTMAFTSSYQTFNSTGLKFVYNDPKVGAVYTTPDNQSSVEGIYQEYGFYAKAPDFRAIIYEYTPDFISDKSIPAVTWTDGKSNSNPYVWTERSGCGSNFGAVTTGLDVNKDLVAAGKNSKGETIYELKDKNSKILKDLYDSTYFPEGQKLTFEQFVAKRPLFYWTDPFGRLLAFKNSDYGPMAECGKPVIYLYPTSTTAVSVKLDPQGGFSHTEPAYNSGWNVIATPKGQLTNISDGKVYPYLFWEGRGGYYQMPDKGFVVSRQDLHQFLVDKLGQLGLNAQETKDFIEFWEPKMQDRPYYFVTFMGNRVMDKIAPLNIDPKPDTVIRVLMDYQGLDKPVAVQGYDIRTPERKGFTAVEWGGVLK